MDKRQQSQNKTAEIPAGSKEINCPRLSMRTAKHWDRLPRTLWSFYHGGFKDLTQQSPEQPGLNAEFTTNSVLSSMLEQMTT